MRHWRVNLQPHLRSPQFHNPSFPKRVFQIPVRIGVINMEQYFLERLHLRFYTTHDLTARLGCPVNEGNTIGDPIIELEARTTAPHTYFVKCGLFGKREETETGTTRGRRKKFPQGFTEFPTT